MKSINTGLGFNLLNDLKDEKLFSYFDDLTKIEFDPIETKNLEELINYRKNIKLDIIKAKYDKNEAMDEINNMERTLIEERKKIWQNN